MRKSIKKFMWAGLWLSLAMFLSGVLTYQILKYKAKQLAAGEDIPAFASLAEPDLSSEVFDAGGKKIGEFSGKRRYYKPLSEIPIIVQKAFVAVEDADFFHHNGISFSGLVRAGFINLKRGGLFQGGSTITQQLARLHFLSSDRTLRRKVDELILAMAIERRFSKKEILTLYLNHVFLGNNAYGVEAAARAYFNKGISEVNAAEAAMLAALPKAPSNYAPHRFFGKAKKRQEFILMRMEEEGYLQPKELERWLGHTVTIADTKLENSKIAPYFVDAVRQEVERRWEFGDLTSRGLKIQTTLDSKTQRAAETVLSEVVKQWKSPSIVDQESIDAGLVVVDAHTGAVRAMVGGLNYAEREFNSVTLARRPIGSLFMPFYYAAAVQQGIGLQNSLYVENHQLEDGKIATADDLSLMGGLMSANSIGSARLMAWTGIGTIVNLCKRLGIESGKEDLSLALGRTKSSLWQMAQAYSVFANGGKSVPLYAIGAVHDRSGDAIYDHRSDGAVKNSEIISEQSAYMVNVALNHVMQFGVGTGRDAFSENGTVNSAPVQAFMPPSVSGMFGFDEDRQDFWFIGYNDEALVGFWIGAEAGNQVLAGTRPELVQLGAKSGAKIGQKLLHDLSKTSKNNDLDSAPAGISFATSRLGDRRISVPVKM